MLWDIFGKQVFFPWWVIVAADILAILLGIWAFVHSRKNRLRIEKEDRIRFSGLKLFSMIVIIAVVSQFGEAIIQLIKGVRYPWMVHVYPYLWYVAIWAVAGLWLVLQLTKKWRFSPDQYVYAKRALILLVIATIPIAIVSRRLMFYPALTLALTSLAILIPSRPLKVLLAIVSPLPLFRLMFSEPFLFIARGASRIGFSIDSFITAFLYSAALVALLVLWYLPSFYGFSYIVVTSTSTKNILKKFRTQLIGWLLLFVLIGYGVYLFNLPAYNKMWRPFIQMDAEYNIQKQESNLEISGNEYFKDVIVKTDSLKKRYKGRIHKEEFNHPFIADWIYINGDESVKLGEKDSLAINWQIISVRPWYVALLELKVDSSGITDAHSPLHFKKNKCRLLFRWYADPPETLHLAANFNIEPGAKLIRKVTASYSEMPIPIEVTSELANIRYRTKVVYLDTLTFSADK